MLILNAAVFGLPYTKTEDDLEMTFQVNHLAQFYLTKLLWEILATSSPSRVVIVSSESHRYIELIASRSPCYSCFKVINPIPSYIGYRNDRKTFIFILLCCCAK